MVLPLPKKATLVFNSSSGWDSAEHAIQMSESTFAEAGIALQIYRGKSGEDLAEVTQAIIAAGSGYILAAGGDGTLRAVAQAVADGGAVMGVLPAGTLNHFARDLGIPLDIDDAITVAAKGRIRQVDVGDVNGQAFLNNAVLGLYPAYRKERDTLEAKGSTGGLAAMRGWLTTLRRFPTLNARISIGDSVLERRSPYILIANNEHQMEGSRPWQRDSMESGTLWVYILHEESRAGLLRNVAKVATGSFQAEEDFEILQASEFTLETSATEPRVSLDGEIAKIAAPLQFRSRPGGLRVVVPA